MEYFSITDVGKVRIVNQDYVYASGDSVGNLPNLFIVADGMGGHKAGDFASRFCVDMVTQHIKESSRKTPIGIIEDAIQNANQELLLKSKEQEELDGMGTTFVAATFVDNIMYVANVGDSRLYVINDEVKQITKDHSLVEEMVGTGELPRQEARFHPNKNIITRAVGSNQYVSPDYFEVSIGEKDTILMCSDGLSNMIDDSEIRDIVNRNWDNMEKIGNILIDRANEYGGRDNIAVILIRQ